jgi:hypothetical protein
MLATDTEVLWLALKLGMIAGVSKLMTPLLKCLMTNS